VIFFLGMRLILREDESVMRHRQCRKAVSRLSRIIHLDAHLLLKFSPIDSQIEPALSFPEVL
jgi:hypothetical protein